jgi:hypothetical protein
MALHIAPCCQNPVDVPVDLASLEQTLVVCPHCGAGLSFAHAALHLKLTEIDGDMARLLALLQDMQAQPEAYLPDEESGAPTGRGKLAAPGVH